MSKMLSFMFIIAALLTIVPISYSDTDDARTAYNEAQTLKRSNQFNAAKEAFQRISELSGSDASNWAVLAADELRYGLPLHEANHLLAKLAGNPDFPARQQTLQQLDTLYQTLFDNNLGNLERITAIEQRRDQLAQLRQAVKSAELTNTEINLQQLRRRIERYRHQSGQWPDRRRLEQELTQTAREAGLAPNRFYIANFYPSSTSFFATIGDTQGSSEIKLKGDENGLKLERAGQ